MLPLVFLVAIRIGHAAKPPPVEATAEAAANYASQFSIVTSVPIGVYGQTFAAAASGNSTQPRLCGVPN